MMNNDNYYNNFSDDMICFETDCCNFEDIDTDSYTVEGGE